MKKLILISLIGFMLLASTTGVMAAEKHTDISGQLNIVEDMIEKDVDILVINPAGPKAIVPAIDKANKKGIPVIVVDTTAEGGASLMGGTGTILGTLYGAFIIGIIRNGLNLLGVASFWQQFAIGLIIIVAVLFDRIRKNKTA